MRKIDRDVSEYYNKKLQLLLYIKRMIYIATTYKWQQEVIIRII